MPADGKINSNQDQDHELPVSSEEIEVCFLLGTGEAWWPTVVESIHVLHDTCALGSGERILATGTVVYKKAHGYIQSRSSVEFSDGKYIRTEEDVGVRGLASWRYPNTADEEDCMDIEEVPIEPQCLPSQSNDAVGSSQEGHTLSTPRSRTGAVEPSDALRTGEKYISSFIRRLSAVEAQVSATRMCLHEDVIRERVAAVRVRARTDLVHELCRPLRACDKIKTEYPFASNIRRNSVTVRAAVDYQLFLYLCTETCSMVSDDMIYPSLERIATTNVSTAVIQFKTSAAFFEWIGIRKCVQKRLFVR